MPGTKAGAAKARKTNLEKNPNYYAEIGSQSWKNPDRSHETGFALLDPEERVELGRKGGKTNKGKTYAKKEIPVPGEIFAPDLTTFKKVSPGASE